MAVNIIPTSGKVCACHKKFRHQYLLIRHIKVMKREICPECFFELRSSTDKDGIESLFCAKCHHTEKMLRMKSVGLREIMGSRHY